MASVRDTPSQGSRKSSRRTVGEFLIEKEVGKGSFAQVYQGWHKVRVCSSLEHCIPASGDAGTNAP